MPHINIPQSPSMIGKKSRNGEKTAKKPDTPQWAVRFSGFLLKFVERFIALVFPEKKVEVRIKQLQLQHTNYLYRIKFCVTHYAKIAALVLFGLFKCAVPVFFVLAGCGIIAFSVWGLDNYGLAIDVSLDNEHIAYIKDEATYDEVQTEIDALLSEKEGDYILDSLPVTKLCFIKKNEMDDPEELKNTLYAGYQEYINQSYALYIDGEIVGTLKNAEDFNVFIEEIVSYYLTGDKTETYSVLNSLEIVRDTYPKAYETTYDDLFRLFTTSVTGEKYTVKKNDTAEKVAEKNDMTLPLLRLLNPYMDLDNLSAGTVLNVGEPKYQLKVQTVRTVYYSEVIPYETKYSYSDSLYEGNTKVKQSGTNGVYTVSAEVREINGVETYREVTGKTKVKDAIARQIIIGTKTIAPSGKFIWPVDGGYVSSGFGYRTLRGEKSFHRGVDIAANKGTEIYAADAGTVITIGYQKNGLGNYVCIDHGNGIYSYYGHCNSISKKISEGSKVYQGQVIAYVGMTGNSTGYHLHFALYNTETGEYFDALPYIKSSK